MDRLKAAPVSTDYPNSLLEQVLEILQLWADTWDGVEAYKSFLNKKSMQHEVEECLPALHYLNEWRKMKSSKNRFVAVDVCGGKGFFSMLLQYLATRCWIHDGGPVLDHIILLEKATRADIDWYHLKADATDSRDLVPVVLWDDCNLHETDALVDRMRTIHHPLALTGIHLCKLLSPSLISLVNLLGPLQCPYLCLAPCCMPRAVTKTAQRKPKRGTKDENNFATTAAPTSSSVRVYSYETDQERGVRIERIQRRDAARRQRRRHDTGEARSDISLGCFCCQSLDHQLQFCPEIKGVSDEARLRILRHAAPTLNPTPCWNCGQTGHFRDDCPNPSIATIKENAEHSLLEPPVTLLDVTKILESADPMRSYCDLLLSSVNVLKQDENDGNPAALWSRKIWETTLVNTKAEKQSTGNWNGGRKSLYMVAFAIN
jgi:Zinc knuckle